jgi:hypothetical protein
LRSEAGDCFPGIIGLLGIIFGAFDFCAFDSRSLTGTKTSR